ncbi:MAG: hypothetical protein K0S32_4365 [Bacteroidetes bacterium]|jgi:hypothetical protein|nr:hypothetical protein [Bacteroidota bacterium]
MGAKGSGSDLIGSDDVLFIFLRAFPDLHTIFVNTKSLNFKPTKEHFDFLENEIDLRLDYANKNATWKSDWDQEKIDFIRRGRRIIKITFKGDEHEINTFGQSENETLLDFISLYDTFTECKHGIKITTEWIFYKDK